MIGWLSAMSRSIILHGIGVFAPGPPPASPGWLVALLFIAGCMAAMFRAMESMPFRPARDIVMVSGMFVAICGCAFFAEAVWETFYWGVIFP